MTHEYCDWCKRMEVKTRTFTMGSNYDIYDAICEICMLQMVKLRRSITDKPPSDIRRNLRIMYMGGDYEKHIKAEEDEIKKHKQEYISL